MVEIIVPTKKPLKYPWAVFALAVITIVLLWIFFRKAYAPSTAPEVPSQTASAVDLKDLQEDLANTEIEGFSDAF